MKRNPLCRWLVVFLFAFLPQTGWAQNYNATISGTVTDPSGAAIPGAKVTLTSVSSGAVSQTATGTDGFYSFPNLTPGTYNLSGSAPGFSEFVQNGIQLALDQKARQDVQLKVGAAVERVEVSANASPLTFDNATQSGGIGPQVLKELPLLVSGNPRSAIAFAILEPGISTGGQDNPFDARINGGLQSGDEAELDGVSMQEGFMSQNGMVSLYQDWPMTPDMVTEVTVLTSNYAPQYGSTTSGVLEAVTKSGTETYHGGIYEYHRNTWLNSRPFDALNQTDSSGSEIAGTARPKDIEHDIGAYIGGPAKHVPGLYGEKVKTYFYVNYEAFRIAGGVNRPIISIPTAAERTGDFRDWVDSNGNLIPVYDPATTVANPSFNASLPLSAVNTPYARQQFMGCNGTTPNVICPSDPRLQSSLAPKWLGFLPSTNLPGATQNYQLPNPVPDTILAGSNYWLITADQQVGSKHHIKESIWYQGAPPKFASTLPQQLANETLSAPQYTNVDRIGWDYNISPTLLNNVHFGYLDRNEGYGAVDAKYASTLPQIPGASAYHVPPQITFGDGFTQFGVNSGITSLDVTRRPTAIINDMLTWVRGKHQFKFGGEYRWIAGYVHDDTNRAGSFSFSDQETGVPWQTSGNSIASFLLEQVDYANVTFRAVASNYPRQTAKTWYVGDTWRATSKLTVDYGIRWDTYSPFAEKRNQASWFDPLGANPGAGGRPGRLAFAGNQWGPASLGRRFPEYVWHKGFAPRLGIAYAMNQQNVFRAGYGIFYDQAFYPGWGGGIAQDGFSNTPSFPATPYGQSPAFILSQGFPQNFARPPFIDSSFDNGQGAPLYRPFEANRLPYAQQWNLSVEHQFSKNFYVNAAYVANKGTRLPSRVAPINVLNPSLLSMGSALNDTFASGQTSLDGVPIPYAGWVDQMKGCAPTVAQALLPYPQYCGTIQGLDENAGSSTYHSLQIKVEKQLSHGMYVLGSYTWSKLLTTASENTQADATTWSGAQGVISPFERNTNKALASDDVPQVLSITWVTDLPFGQGQRFLNRGGILNKVVGGWQMSHIFRASSGLPLFFRSGNCSIPGQFRQGCIPGIIPGADPFAQSKGSFDPDKGPLFNVNAFEPFTRFNNTDPAFQDYQGSGSRITTVRGFGYHNENMSFIKNTKISERLNFQIRAEFFNLFNWHTFTSSGEWGGQAFNNDVSNITGSGAFGTWNGSVSNPRNIQVGARFEF
jgi:hypothetical protein